MCPSGFYCAAGTASGNMSGLKLSASCAECCQVAPRAPTTTALANGMPACVSVCGLCVSSLITDRVSCHAACPAGTYYSSSGASSCSGATSLHAPRRFDMFDVCAVCPAGYYCAAGTASSNITGWLHSTSGNDCLQ